MMKLIFIALACAGAFLVLTVMIASGSRNHLSVAVAGSSTSKESGEKPLSGNGQRTAVIVELFTSEGCSSCPPADQVLAQLDQGQPVDGTEVIALSEHVDYWNYIGWNDPFSSPAFGARQESYAGIFNRESIYTPQMVVDGQSEFVGSNATKAREAIARSARSPKADVKISPVATAEKDLLKIKVEIEKTPAATSGDIAEVLLAVTESNLSSQVARGENSGRRLAHTGVVRELRALGKIDPASKSFAGEASMMIPGEWKRDQLRAVVFVQERSHRRILGAAQINLAAK